MQELLVRVILVLELIPLQLQHEFLLLFLLDLSLWGLLNSKNDEKTAHRFQNLFKLNILVLNHRNSYFGGELMNMFISSLCVLFIQSLFTLPVQSLS